MKQFIKNRSSRIALALTVAALGFSTPALANPAPTPTPTPTCSSGSVCGVPVTTHVVAIDFGALTFGQGIVQSVADGDWEETKAYVSKTSGIDIKGEVSGNACTANCGTAKTTGSAFEKIETAGYATAIGKGSASAGVANASEGGIGLLARIRTGTATPSTGNTGH